MKKIIMTPYCDICQETHPDGDITFRDDQVYTCLCPNHAKYYDNDHTLDAKGWILIISEGDTY